MRSIGKELRAIGFCLMGVLPILAIVILYAYRQWVEPTALERKLSLKLSTLVAIQDVDHPRPGRVGISAIQLRDPLAPAKLVAQGNAVSISKTTHGVLIRIENMLLRGEYLQDVLKHLMHRILAEQDLMQRVMTVHCPQIEIRHVDHSIVLQETRLRAFRELKGIKAEITFRIGSNTDQGPIRIRYFRPDDPTNASAFVELICDESAIPCQLLSAEVNSVSQWFQGGQFLGRIFHAEAAGVNRTEIIGKIVDLGPSSFCQPRSDAKMSFQATLQIRKGILQDGQLEAFDGSFEVQSGRVRYDSVADLCDAWKIHWRDPPPQMDAEGMVDFDRLAFQCQYRRDYLTVSSAETMESGAVMTLDGVTLAELPQPGSYSAVPSVREARKLEDVLTSLPRFH